jgi:acetyltransferase-like isoleucine patch superfamily enzyme
MLYFLKKILIIFKWLLIWPKLILRNSKCHNTSRVEKICLIKNSVIGKYNYIGQGCIMNRAQIGNYCSIAPYVQIGGMEHSWQWGSTSTRISDYCIDVYETIIEDDVWIGANAIIKQGIKIGRGAVIGSGAIVLKDVDPYTIVFGAPAKFYKKRFSDETIEALQKSRFWDQTPPRAKVILNGIIYK